MTRARYPITSQLIDNTSLINNQKKAFKIGSKKGLEYAKKKGLLAYFLVKTGTGFDEVSTKAFNVYMSAFER